MHPKVVTDTACRTSLTSSPTDRCPPLPYPTPYGQQSTSNGQHPLYNGLQPSSNGHTYWTVMQPNLQPMCAHASNRHFPLHEYVYFQCTDDRIDEVAMAEKQ